MRERLRRPNLLEPQTTPALLPPFASPQLRSESIPRDVASPLTQSEIFQRSLASRQGAAI